MNIATSLHYNICVSLPWGGGMEGGGRGIGEKGGWGRRDGGEGGWGAYHNLQ